MEGSFWTRNWGWVVAGGAALVAGAAAVHVRRRRVGFGLTVVQPDSTSGHVFCPHCHEELALEPSRPKLRSSAEAYVAISKVASKRKVESLWVLLLNSQNQVVHKHELCKGTANACVVHPRDVFGEALRRRAIAIIISHNHPSGDPVPSPEDDALTKRMVESGRMLGVPVLDHLVVGKAGRYFSYADAGRMR